LDRSSYSGLPSGASEIQQRLGIQISRELNLPLCTRNRQKSGSHSLAIDNFSTRRHSPLRSRLRDTIRFQTQGSGDCPLARGTETSFHHGSRPVTVRDAVFLHPNDTSSANNCRLFHISEHAVPSTPEADHHCFGSGCRSVAAPFRSSPNRAGHGALVRDYRRSTAQRSGAVRGDAAVVDSTALALYQRVSQYRRRFSTRSASRCY